MRSIAGLPVPTGTGAPLRTHRSAVAGAQSSACEVGMQVPLAVECSARAVRRVRLAAAGAIVAGAAALLVAFCSDGAGATAPRSRGAVYGIERDGLRYEFHAIMGTETLWRAADAPDGRRNLARARPDDVARMRCALLAEWGAASLESLRARHREAIEDMRRLGYL